MAESITITTNPPELQSENFEFLREQGVEHLQELAGSLWTDYNLSDPGITILELLCYAITDLGYRSSFSIPDILAQNPDSPQIDLKNFYTAREILPMCPVTFNDYRKLLIDVEVQCDPSDDSTVGVKNAWIEKAPENEVPVFVNAPDNKLDYTPVDPNNLDQLNIQPLYNILLEFGRCEKFGDLNENTIEGRLTLYNICPNPTPDLPTEFVGISLRIVLKFESWSEDIDWSDKDQIKENIQGITLDFDRFPSGYTLQGYGLLPDKSLWINITEGTGSGAINVSTDCMIEQIQNLIYGPSGTGGFIEQYQEKVFKIFEIVDQVRAKLMANRNLCEDFYKIQAFKVEEIAMCGDIVIDTQADVEDVEAQIFFAVIQFLSPTVFFYTLQEMYDKGYKTEEIFEGPRLNHGFIDDAELDNADRRRVIHVSDLYQIIMDVPGVLAVRDLQIANIPLDNDDNIISQSVKWCLKLAVEQNYIPRLSTERSALTYLKEDLPYLANEAEVDLQLDELLDSQRSQKLINPQLDIPVPQGTFKDIDQYTSVQEEFPLTYGIGSEGLDQNSTDQRKAQAKQMKGFLMFFDQLLVDYLSQLDHVGELFSMNGEKDASGNFIIDKSYFTESLIPYVPKVLELLQNDTTYPQQLQEITENEDLFFERRNRFLDHLMARFAEQFTDYALLVYNLDGKKAPKELLTDKLEFLNRYPDISGGRFKGFNYESPCNIWDVNNVSGLEKRMELLTGIRQGNGQHLQFSPSFEITQDTSGEFFYTIEINTGSSFLLHSIQSYTTEADAKLAIEHLIINGITSEKYEIIFNPDTPAYFIAVVCEGNTLAISDPYASETSAQNDLDAFVSDAVALFEAEFYNNPESNRNDLACPILNYFSLGTNPVSVDMIPDPPEYIISYELLYYSQVPSADNIKLLDGPYLGFGECKEREDIVDVDSGTSTISIAGDFSDEISSGDPVTIVDSSNNGDYTVQSVNVTPTGSGGFQTDITLSGSPVLDNTPPFGILKFNTISESNFQAEAESRIESSLYEVAAQGIDTSNYVFTDYTLEPYKFHIIGRCGQIIGTSFKSNFNADIATSLSGSTIEVIGSTDNDGTYNVNNSTAEGALIALTIDEALTSAISDGHVVYTESGIAISTINSAKNEIVVPQDLSLKLFTGDTFEVSGSTDGFNGTYSIAGIIFNGSNTIIHTVESIPAGSGTDFGSIGFSKNLEISQIELNGSPNNIIKIIGGADTGSVNELILFFKEKFFSKEGMHLAEHILLRPKFNDDLFLPFGPGVADLEPSSGDGSLAFKKQLSISGVDQSNNLFLVPSTSDISTQFTPLSEILVEGSTDGINDGEYELLSASWNGSEVELKVLQNIPAEVLTDFGKVLYDHDESIDSISNPNIISIDADASEISQDFPVTISGASSKPENNGSFKIKDITGAADIEVDERQVLVQDALMPINLQSDCPACSLDNPYSFLFTVVMPAWQGRFANQNFRQFFQRSLRTETPAHLIPGICWVDCEQMREFEEKFKRWIIENQKTNKDPLVLSNALSDLIEILSRLRSQYPEGTLHECGTDDDIPENSIILNRSVIGTN